MININTSSWHYRLIKTANLKFIDPRYYDATLSLDMVDWNSCSYVGAFFRALFKLVLFGSITLFTSYAMTHFIITVFIAGLNSGFNSATIDNGLDMVRAPGNYFNLITYAIAGIISFVIVGVTCILIALGAVGLCMLGVQHAYFTVVKKDKSSEELAKSWWHKYCTKVTINRDSDRFDNFKDFYHNLYLKEHENKTSRILHFIGTTGAIALLLTSAFTRDWSYALTAVFVGYGFAWVGHFFFEKNRPATFEYPLYSLAGDFRLWFEILTRKRYFNWTYRG